MMETGKEREGNAKKRKPGRPRKPIKKDSLLMVRLTPAELMVIQGKAREAGLKVSEWFRQAARSAIIVSRLSTEEMGWLRTLSGLANNLNQITKLAHQQGLISLTAIVRKIVGEVDLLMAKLMGNDR